MNFSKFCTNYAKASSSLLMEFCRLSFETLRFLKQIMTGFFGSADHYFSSITVALDLLLSNLFGGVDKIPMASFAKFPSAACAALTLLSFFFGVFITIPCFILKATFFPNRRFENCINMHWVID